MDKEEMNDLKKTDETNKIKINQEKEYKTKKHDFVKISFTGYIKDTNEIFDTTDEKIARNNNIYDKNKKYNDLIICIGERNVIEGLDKRLVGLKLNTEYTLEIPAEEAFGKKSSKLIRLTPLAKFKESNIKPFPGLQLNIDGKIATVRTISSGRVILDFNHPLAGKDLIYKIIIKEIISDPIKKAKNYILNMGIPVNEIKRNNKELTITLPFKINKEFESLLTELKKKLIELIPEIKVVKYIEFNNEIEKTKKMQGPNKTNKNEDNKTNKS